MALKIQICKQKEKTQGKHPVDFFALSYFKVWNEINYCLDVIFAKKSAHYEILLEIRAYDATIVSASRVQFFSAALLNP